MPPEAEQSAFAGLPDPVDLRAYVDYLRDLGIYDLLDRSSPEKDAATAAWASAHLCAVAPRIAAKSPEIAGRVHELPPARPLASAISPFERAQQRGSPFAVRTALTTGPVIEIQAPLVSSKPEPPEFTPPYIAPDMPAPTPFNQLAPVPAERVAPAQKPAALQALREHIGDCTRCPLAYAGRHKIVFADGDPQARLMFVGEGPGADEDMQGLPFVGKAGQLLNNMIAAMGLRREQVYIANVVKCRPPKNRTPEPVEANTCSPFLLQQIDIVQPEVIVALGGTAATYLLGVKQSLTSLRGRWFDVRGSKCAVTYHPAFLLRDPRQKGEAWKDLQRVMAELKLKPPARV